MIITWILDAVVSVVSWVVGLMGAALGSTGLLPSSSGSAVSSSGSGGIFSTIITYAAGLSPWIPWGTVSGCVLAVLSCLAYRAVANALRIILRTASMTLVQIPDGE